ncbi:hypothetical protein [Acidithiobacillus sp.]|uniref:hypothetical protein n=1 Tax=Acidithiobacillus sp. TaxID=1872118 RepID=UPI002582A67C|nr:hypothetical protein [Acidithiobacillus sp.]MDD5375765.1 hypothetical protein [Acidithiobacillus sp.]
MTLRDEIKGMWATFREDVDTADQVADRILSLIAAEKARGPDPLLVQAREALQLARPCVTAVNKDGSILAVIDAALGLEGKE